MLRSILILTFLLLSFGPAAVAQSPNDECSTAAVIASLPYSIQQDTRLATPNNADPVLFCQDSAKNGKTVWFRYTADTSRFVVFSTIGSQPMEDYDIVMAVFTGACNSLTLLRCNDDTLDVRQSVIGLHVTAGTTYTVMIGEWGGGGPWGGFPTGGDLLLNVTAPERPPIVRGPRTGSISGVITTTTDNFGTATEIPLARPKLPKPIINKRVPKLPLPANAIAPTGPYGSNYFEDPIRTSREETAAMPVNRPVALQSFEGIPQTNFIPPDPIIAAGPQHVLTAVNSTFRIFSKDGSVLKTIDADLWYDQVLPGASTFDPIVMYDHFDQRWLMVMLHVDDQKKTAVVFLSISDDANPLGVWHHWPLPAHWLGDSVVTNWTDYARVGFDKDAVYITGNQFGFSSDFAYSKLRVIPKAQLTMPSPKNVQWYDFWDFRDPDNPNTVIFGLRPSITFGQPGRQFLLNDAPYFLGTFFTMWTLDSVLTRPLLTGTNIPVVQYFPSPDAGQRDGGAIPLEAFGADIRNEPVFRDSVLWAVHAVASGPSKEYSAVRYVAFDPFLKKTVNDVAFGLEGYWHSYPALMVNKDGDLTVTFSRSGLSEYIGAFMTGRKAQDPPGLAASVTIREGRGNYVVDFGSGRNRWGDYSGIALDPSDERSMWTHTEFAASRNKWGTWVTRSVIGPVPGAHLTTDRTFIDFGSKNVGVASDTAVITLTNDGSEPLTLSALSIASASFKLILPGPLPLVIPSLGTLAVKVLFSPVTAGVITDSIRYCAAPACVTLSTLAVVNGRGFQIVPSVPGTMYAATGSAGGGNLYQLNTSTGSPTLLGATGIGQVTSLRVHPTTKELIALDPTGSVDGGSLYRISVAGNSHQKLSDIPVTNLKGLAFIDDSSAYMADFNGRIFRVNIFTGRTTQLASTGLRISGLAVNPLDGMVWFCLRATSGTVDALYRFDPVARTVTLKGRTGLSIANADLLFDKEGRLYVLAGHTTAKNLLLIADTTDGKAIKVLETGMSYLTSLALNPDAVAAVFADKNNGGPMLYSLEQNYPNPFNPLTVIEFTVPERSLVRLEVIDALGRIVQTLADGMRPAGRHREYFDATGLASGSYFYRLRAGSYRATRSMLLVK